MTVDPSAMTEAGPGGTARVADDAAPVAGMSIGKYRLDRVLGAGGMGVVWAAYDPDLERPVAIKLLRSVDNAVTLRTRLLREARAMARLKHPNVLTVYEVGTDRNRDYIAMELIDGADLDAWLVARPPRAEIFAALLAAGRGLAAAHGAGLIHRDLKPHNILRGRDGGVYVTDFGLARGQIYERSDVEGGGVPDGSAGGAGVLPRGIDDGAEVVQAGISPALAATAVANGSQPRGIDSVLDSPLTQTGVLIGTPAYMAPEQFIGRAPDPRSDQFAFSVTAWEALTGARPFAGKTLDELRVAALAGVGGADGPGELALPPRVRAVLVRGLAADPAARWPDMPALLRELEAAIAPPRRSRAPLVIGVALAVAGFLGGVAIYLRSHSASPAPPKTTFTVPIPHVELPERIEIPDHVEIPIPPIPPSPGPHRTPAPPRPPHAPRSPHSPGPHAVASGGRECAPADQAFGAAWSADRRAAVVARHKAEREMVAVTALLDEVRRDWIKAYDATCASPSSETRQERLTCLLEARDEINETTDELTRDDSEVSLAATVPLNITVGACQRE